MSTRQPPTKASDPLRILKIAKKTTRRELFWLGDERKELDVYQIPIKHLYFNIENGRYADKMVQLRQDNPGVEIDPREEKWRGEIRRMLKGEYSGTEKDKESFDILRKDILARKQLHPGVALNDGGVLDGNRRLAVLLELYDTEKNPSRFEYLDAVILPEDVSSEDRWRIEAGLQIGKDEKLDYSPINRLLKIKEGLTLFQNTGDPAKEIANTLIGITKEEVADDIKKIRLIDQYLDFIKKPNAYGSVSGVMERFEEAVNTLESARRAKTSPDQVAALRLKLFTIIRFDIMDNWEMRDIKVALGVPGRGQRVQYKNERAFSNLIKVQDKDKLTKAIIAGNKADPVVQEELRRAESFTDAMAASKAVGEPVRLAQRAQTNLEQLMESLDGGQAKNHKEWSAKAKSLQQILQAVSELAAKCATAVKKIKS